MLVAEFGRSSERAPAPSESTGAPPAASRSAVAIGSAGGFHSGSRSQSAPSAVA